MTSSISDGKRFKSVSKAISALTCFNSEELEWSPAEISKKVGLHRATGYRLLETLAKAGFVEKNEANGKYSVGPTLYSIGMLYLNSKDLFKVAEPVVKVLNDLTEEVVTIGILHHNDYINVIREESKHTIRLSYSVGSRFPAHATATGKSLLSELGEEVIDRLYPEEKLEKFTDKTIASKIQLKRELGRIRESGVAINKEELREGVWAVSSVIHDVTGSCVGSLGIAAPTIRTDDALLERYATLVKIAAGFISYRLGDRHLTVSATRLQDIYSWWEQNRVPVNR